MSEVRSQGHRFATLYDTAKRCLIIMDQLFADLEDLLRKVNDTVYLQSNPDITVRIYICVFSMIDFANRFDQIVDAMPLLSKRRPEVRQLHSALRPLAESRNYIQHIRNHLSKVDKIDFPILGSISWIIGNRNYVLLPTQMTEGYGTPGITYDSLAKQYMCKYQFAISSYQIALDSIYQESKIFWKWLEGASHIDPAEIKKYEWGGPNILYSEFEKP